MNGDGSYGCVYDGWVINNDMRYDDDDDLRLITTMTGDDGAGVNGWVMVMGQHGELGDWCGLVNG